MRDSGMHTRATISTDLFLSFLKIGLFTFGGGYAMISVIQDTCVDKKQWISHDEMMDITIIAESTPGPIAINCATYVGYKTAGFTGAVTATLGIVLPSFFIIYIISQFLDSFLEYPVISSAFKGIRIGVGFLILNVGLNMAKKTSPKIFPRIVMGCAFTAMLLIRLFSWRFSSVGLMLVAGWSSLGIHFIRRRNGKA